jgi:hypothetical protein
LVFLFHTFSSWLLVLDPDPNPQQRKQRKTDGPLPHVETDRGPGLGLGPGPDHHLVGPVVIGLGLGHHEAVAVANLACAKEQFNVGRTEVSVSSNQRMVPVRIVTRPRCSILLPLLPCN